MHMSYPRNTIAVAAMGAAWLVGCADVPQTPRSDPNAVTRADAGTDLTTTVRTPVAFDGRSSSTGDGEIVAYLWDFGDGGSSDLPNPVHIFGQPGEFSVALTVTDERGGSATDRLIVTVVDPSDPGDVNLPPIASGGADIQATVGQAIEFDGTGSVDPDGEIVAFAWSFGDGATSEQPNPTHTYTEAGRFNVTLTVTDNAGASSSDLVLVTVIELVTLTVEVEPQDAGTVTVDSPGSTFEAGTMVTVTASPKAGFLFVSFTDEAGNTLGSAEVLDFEIVQDTVITANFSPLPTFVLTVNVSPPGSGSVLLDPPGGSYIAGTVVTLTALASDGYAFTRYAEGALGTMSTTTITLNADTTVLAEFLWVPAIGNPGNLLATGFLGGNVTEFDRFDGTNLGEIVPNDSGGLLFRAGIEFGPDGNLYVVDAGFATNPSVLRYDGFSGQFIDTVAVRTGLAGFLTLAFDPAGSLLVADGPEDRILTFDRDGGGQIGTFVTQQSGGLDNPIGLTFGPNGNLFVVSQGTHSIIEYEGATGAAIGTFADLGTAGLSVPVDLIFGPSGDLFVSIGGDSSVARIDGMTGDIDTFVAPGSGGLSTPGGIRIHPDSKNVLVVSQDTDTVLEYDGATGEFVRVFAAGSDGDLLFFIAVRP